MLFRDLDIADRLKDALDAQGFKEMYPPQAKAIPVALTGRNLVAAVPTASGKSMIGFVPALNMVLTKHRKVLYIVPLKALASEKRDDLDKFSHLGIKVMMTSGDPDHDDDISGADIVIATSEKADSMLRHNNRWIEGLGLVIADEVHMIHEPGRGPTLEVAMTKFMSRIKDLQTIALSATVSNAEDLRNWLDAELVQDSWRPTKLKEGVYFDELLEFNDESHMTFTQKGDPIWAMMEQTIREGGQCLVFVNSRRSTEAVASRFNKKMKALTNASISPAEKELIEGGAESTATGVKLAECISCGIAFHHAGLDYKQRRCVEEGFRNRTIKCIVATPTLAAGINLPARRVIIRDTTRFEVGSGTVPIPVMDIKQMCGRAGRPGYDPWGEAVLVAKSVDDADHLWDDYVFHDTERLTSKLGNEKVLRGHILGLIATGDTSSEQEIKEFMEMTFYGATCSLLGIERVITSVVDFLSENGMVERAGDMVRILPFGKRVSDLYIDPWTAVILHKAVDKMDQDTDELMILHALACTPDVMGLYPKKTDLDMLQAVDMEYDGKYLCNIYDETGVDEDDEYGEDEKMSDIHLSDLKTAIMLRDWVNELSEDHITDYMKIGPGDIRSRVDNAEWILYSMNEVAYIFNPDATKYIKPLLTRLRYGVKDELIPLVSFRGIGRGRARILYDAGICNRQDLVDVDLLTLSKLPKIGNALAKSLKAQVGPSLEPDLPYAMSRQEEDEMDFMLEKMAAEMDPGGSASSEPVPEQAPAKGKAGPAVKKSKTRQVSLDMF